MAEHVLSLLRGLSRERFHLSLVCSKRGLLASQAKGLDIPVRAIAFSPLFNIPRLDQVIRLALLIAQKKPHILHTHSWQAWLLAYLALRFFRHRPLVLSTIHGFPPKGLRWRWMTQCLAHSVNHVICVSRALSLLWDAPQAHTLEVIPNGIDLHTPAFTKEEAREKLGLPQRVPVVGTVARLAPQKGVRLLLQAAAQLEGVHFAVLGEGPLRGELEAASRKSGLAARFSFLGHRPGARDFLKAFDVIVIPSLSEGSSLAAMEAMAAARPVVASRLGALEEIVAHGETGLLVPPGNPEALARAIAELLSESTLAQKMGEAGRLRVEREFSIERMLERTAAVYENLASSLLRRKQ